MASRSRTKKKIAGIVNLALRSSMGGMFEGGAYASKTQSGRIIREVVSQEPAESHLRITEVWSKIDLRPSLNPCAFRPRTSLKRENIAGETARFSAFRHLLEECQNRTYFQLICVFDPSMVRRPSNPFQVHARRLGDCQQNWVLGKQSQGFNFATEIFRSPET